MSYLITPERIPQLREQYAAGNPYVGYPVWYNQTWPLNIDPVYAPANIFLLWAITGDQKWMDLLTEKFHVPTERLDKNTKRECGVYWISMHTLLAPHWTPERLSVLESELKLMMTQSIKTVYSWDADDRISVLVKAAMMDERFGTSYLTADSKDPTSPYYCEWETMPQHLKMQQDAWAHECIDGATSESAGYTVNTYKSTLYGIGCLNDLSRIPGLAEWLPKFREFMLWSVSSDYKQAINYGDANNQIDPAWELILWYRIPMLALLAGIGLDEDGAIADMIAGLCEARAGGKITEPSQLHSILNWGAHLITDFSLIPLDGPREPLPSGFKAFRNFGAIYRDENCYFYATATVWLHDDHDYRKGNTDYRLYVNAGSECPINRPGEYAGTWVNYNAAAIKGQTEFPDRGLVSAEFINGKLIAKARHRGPTPPMNGKPFDLPPGDYHGHEWITTIEFTPANIGTQLPCLKVLYDWKHDGVFPDPAWNPYMPDLREFRPFEVQQFITGGLVKLDESQKLLEWSTPKGREMVLSYDGSEEVALVPWVYRDVEHFKRFRMYSDRHDGFHELAITAGVIGAVPPPPPPPPLEWFDAKVLDDDLPPPSDLIIVDNLSVGYYAYGRWIRFPGQGVGDSVDYVVAGDGSQLAGWRAKVAPGVYNISVIWVPFENRATDAPFAIRLDGKVLQTSIVNQERPPGSFEDFEGRMWHTLADVTVAVPGILEVELNDKADDHVLADAVRFERLRDIEPPPPPLPELNLPLTFQHGKYKIDRDSNGVICLAIKPPVEIHERD